MCLCVNIYRHVWSLGSTRYMFIAGYRQKKDDDVLFGVYDCITDKFVKLRTMVYAFLSIVLKFFILVVYPKTSLILNPNADFRVWWLLDHCLFSFVYLFIIVADFRLFVFLCLRPERNSVISTFALGEDAKTRQTKGADTKDFHPRTPKLQQFNIRPFTCLNFVISPGIYRVVVSSP